MNLEIENMESKTSTKITLDLSEELDEDELKSFRDQAQKEGHSLKEHVTELLFGKKETAA